jgi:hypothetical protein
MSKYHLNYRGEPGLCSATVKPCPFGGPDDHFETENDARKAYEKQARKAVFSKSHKKHVTSPLPQDPSEANPNWLNDFAAKFSEPTEHTELSAAVITAIYPKGQEGHYVVMPVGTQINDNASDAVSKFKFVSEGGSPEEFDKLSIDKKVDYYKQNFTMVKNIEVNNRTMILENGDSFDSKVLLLGKN